MKNANTKIAALLFLTLIGATGFHQAAFADPNERLDAPYLPESSKVLQNRPTSSATSSQSKAQFFQLLSNIRVMQADFNYFPIRKNATNQAPVSGQFYLDRDGRRFAWHPDENSSGAAIVVSGDKVSMFDRDLNQLTVTNLKRPTYAGSAAGVALLYEAPAQLAREYTVASIKCGMEGAGTCWQLRPRRPMESLKSVTFEFNGNLLRSLIVSYDAYALRTNFTNVRYYSEIPGSWNSNDGKAFDLRVPANAEIVK